MTRREAITSVLAAALSSPAFLIGEQTENLSVSLDGIEKKSRGRLGCAVLDTSTGKLVGHRLDERFPLCSTFKFLATSLVLERVDKGAERLDRRIVFSSKELVSYSPITKQYADRKGMTVSEICRAALTMSDNTAGNLLLGSFGGPQALTAFLRSIGDPVTRLDRTEPTLNEARRGDPRDTTSPRAMIEDMHRVLSGNILKPASRTRLSNWLVECKTGTSRLRAGMPKTWRIGDKTGTGDNGTANDIAVVWRRRRAPLLVAAYLTECPLSPDAQSAILADVGRAVSAGIKSA